MKTDLPASGMPRQFVTAREIAALKVRGYPGSKKGISRRAELEAWPYITKAARGGQRREYLIARLPEQVQEAFVKDTFTTHKQGSDTTFAAEQEIIKELRALRAALGAAYLLSGSFGSLAPVKLEAYQALTELAQKLPATDELPQSDGARA